MTDFRTLTARLFCCGGIAQCACIKEPLAPGAARAADIEHSVRLSTVSLLPRCTMTTYLSAICSVMSPRMA